MLRQSGYLKIHSAVFNGVPGLGSASILWSWGSVRCRGGRGHNAVQVQCDIMPRHRRRAVRRRGPRRSCVGPCPPRHAGPCHATPVHAMPRQAAPQHRQPYEGFASSPSRRRQRRGRGEPKPRRDPAGAGSARLAKSLLITRTARRAGKFPSSLVGDQGADSTNTDRASPRSGGLTDTRAALIVPSRVWHRACGAVRPFPARNEEGSAGTFAPTRHHYDHTRPSLRRGGAWSLAHPLTPGRSRRFGEPSGPLRRHVH